nr:preprotein translocase subunit YajC [bacterium]
MISQETGNNIWATLSSLLLPIGIIVLFYFIAIRPQQKKDKQLKNMRSNLSNGDRVTTIGGFFGRVVAVKDDVITIEVGPDKTRLMIARWAIGSVEGQEANGEQLEAPSNAE